MKLDFCAICGTKEHLHHHHWQAKSRGGSDDETNILTVCPTHHGQLHGYTNMMNHKVLQAEGIARSRILHPEKWVGGQPGRRKGDFNKVREVLKLDIPKTKKAKILGISRQSLYNYISQIKKEDEQNKSK